MRQGKKITYMHKAALALFVLTAGTGCIATSSEVVQLKNDLAGLKAEQKKDADKIASLHREIEKSRRQLLLQDEGLKRETKKSRAGSAADMESLRAEFSKLTGRFEETEHLTKRTAADLSLFLEAAEERLTAIESAIDGQEKNSKLLSAEIEALKKVAPPEQEKEEAIMTQPANKIYKDALQLIQNNQPAEARKLFRNYLKSYPEGSLAGNALFWIGESYYDEKNYERAIVEYDDMVKKHPKGIKVPAALLKQAMAFDRLKDGKTAKALFDKLVKGYPKSDEAKRAKDILKKRKVGKNKKAK